MATANSRTPPPPYPRSALTRPLSFPPSQYPTHKAFKDVPPGLFDGDGALSLLSRRARRVHIGTHSAEAADDAKLAARFVAHGWEVVWAFPKHTKAAGAQKTPYGRVMFGDGVLSFLNKRKLTAHADGRACDL